MSVNNVNSIYQTQGMTGAQSGTPIVQIEENETNIGAWLLGGAAVIATGAAICAGKGKKVSGDQGFVENICNGFKSLFSKNGDEVAETVGNAVTKSADEVADGVKKYVDLDDVNSLTNSQKIKKAQDVLEAAQNNLTVSNKKALKHMENIDNITISLYQKESNGKLSNKLIDKIDDTVFATINGTKGLEGAFELDKDGKSLIIKDSAKFNAYFGKRAVGFIKKTNDEKININELAQIFKNKSDYYTQKQNIIATRLKTLNNNLVLDENTANNILKDQISGLKIKALVNREADFKSLKDNQFYKDNTGLLQERVKAAGYGENTSLFKQLFPLDGGGGSITSSPSTTQLSTSSSITSSPSTTNTSSTLGDQWLDEQCMAGAPTTWGNEDLDELMAGL